MNELKDIMKDCLETRGYKVTEDKLDELFYIYEDCQEWNDDEMITGNTYDEVEDFVKHSSCVNEVFVNVNDGDWIPCDKELPKEHTLVLASFKIGKVDILGFYNGLFHGFRVYGTDEILAWMQLPEPYKTNRDAEIEFRYEINCGSREAMEMIAKKGRTALNPKTMKWQIIDKDAKYQIRVDKVIKNSETGEDIECCTLLSDKDLWKIAEEKGLICS